MSISIETIVFFLLCLGQIWALMRGRLTAVIYYLCAAPMVYFFFWKVVVWDPSRACGLLLAAGGLLLYRQPARIRASGPSLLFVFLVFVATATLVGSQFWPIEAMETKSAAYSTLRGYIQIFNWMIILGVSWQIALVLRGPGAFETMRRVIITVGVVHCLHAFYQSVAFWTGLPLTGIRRASMQMGVYDNCLQLAGFSLGGMKIYRATSFLGEPKGFGATSFLWITALLTIYLEGRVTMRTHLTLLLFVLALGLTFSTSAWALFPICIAMACYASAGHRNSRFLNILIVVLLLGGILMFVDSLNMLPAEVSLMNVFETRWSGRMKDPLSDVPVRESLRVLSENPLFAVFGTGLGGITFYISQNLGGGGELVLAPNVGWVNMLCDMGLVGMGLILAAMWGGIRNFLSPRAHCDNTCRCLAFMGCVLLCQSLIVSASYLLAACFGFLLASELRSEESIGFYANRDGNPQTRTMLNQPGLA